MIHSPRRHPAGLTLVESVVALMIVSIALVSAMRAVGGAGLKQYKNAERLTAGFLADGLMSEIMAMPYADPSQTPAFGTESGETSRSLFDDVDDYNGYTESNSITDRSGTVIATGRWTRSVTVDYVTSANPAVTSVTETGVKRITVAVKNNNAVIVQRVALRTNAP